MRRRWAALAGATAVVVGTVAGGSALPVLIPAATASAASLPSVMVFDDDGTGVFEAAPAPTGRAGLVGQAGTFPTVSPDGLELAYLVASGTTTKGQGLTEPTTVSIVVAGRSGADPHTLLSGPYGYAVDSTKGNPDSIEYPLAWSPNGKELAYGCDGWEPDATMVGGLQENFGPQLIHICLLDVATGAHRLLDDPASSVQVEAAGTASRFSWSPNGEDIYTSVLQVNTCPAGVPSYDGPVCGNPAIGEVSASTGATRMLIGSDESLPVTQSITYEDPQLSPDGTKLLYSAVPYDTVGSLGTEGGLKVLDLANGSDKVVYPADSTVAPTVGAVWSPDSRSIAFPAQMPDRFYTAYEIPAGGGAPTALFVSSEPVYDLAWAPTVTTCTVPDVVGKKVPAATALLKRAACNLGQVTGPKAHRKTGPIVAQSPKAGADEPAGTPVNVRVR